MKRAQSRNSLYDDLHRVNRIARTIRRLCSAVSLKSAGANGCLATLSGTPWQ